MTRGKLQSRLPKSSRNGCWLYAVLSVRSSCIKIIRWYILKDPKTPLRNAIGVLLRQHHDMLSESLLQHKGKK